ncbi:MAG: anti-sigma factor RsiW [Rhodothermales bacterium]|jgi:anti-sigma factor RsiW
MKLDTNTLAAYLSGELPTDERQSIAVALVKDEAAREILHIACEALAAALQHDPVVDHLVLRASRPPARPNRFAIDRRPVSLPYGEA